MPEEHTLLTDLLPNNRFDDEFLVCVNDLAKDFRSRHGLGTIHQLGLVVHDVEKAAEELNSLGLSAWFIAAGSTTSWHENGHDKDYEGKLGIAYFKNLINEFRRAL